MRRSRPYRGENPEPGKDVYGELDPWPGIREQPGPIADMAIAGEHSDEGARRRGDWLARTTSEQQRVGRWLTGRENAKQYQRELSGSDR